MCELLRGFKFSQCKQVFVISSSTDLLSESFLGSYLSGGEERLEESKVKYLKTSRTNEVLQSKLSSVWSTLRAFVHALWVICAHLLGTSHLVSNGPGIAIPYFYIFYLLNKLKVTNAKLIFVESWCRVKTISLAGKLAQYVADEYVVHW